MPHCGFGWEVPRVLGERKQERMKDPIERETRGEKRDHHANSTRKVRSR